MGGGGGDKDGGYVGLTIPHLLAECLDILEPTTSGALGPVQACGGIVLQLEKPSSTIFFSLCWDQRSEYRVLYNGLATLNVIHFPIEAQSHKGLGYGSSFLRFLDAPQYARIL